MNFSLGGVKRGFLVATTVLLLSVSLSACSDDSSPLDDKTTATPDAKVAAEAAVKDLVDGYWAAVVKAENSANPDPEQFRDVAKGTFIESELKRLRTYEEGNIRRVGEPEVTAVEVTVTGDKADVRACLNEDDWAAEQDGKKLEAPGRARCLGERKPHAWTAHGSSRMSGFPPRERRNAALLTHPWVLSASET